MGPIISIRNDGSVKCHAIDAASGKKAPHHFVLDGEPKIEDTGIKEILEWSIIVIYVNVIICKWTVFLAT